MKKLFAHINYADRVSELEIEEIKEIFHGFEVKTERRGIKAGAIDILTIIEISLGFVVAQYFRGLISEAGKSTWKSIASGLKKYLDKNKRDKDATALIFYLNEIPIYAIERFHDDYAECSINAIPTALIKADSFFRKYGIPEDARLMQIFQDPETKKWKYLFLPSTEAFGSYIDRIVDLDTFELFRPADQKEFIEYFCGECEGGHCLVCAKYHFKKR